MLLRLELQRSQAEEMLLDQQRLRTSVRVSSGYLQKLEAAATNYKQAVTKLITSEEMDINSRMAYISKLKEQQKLTDPIIGQLQGAIDFFNTFNRAARVFACIQTKIQSMHKTINAKIAMVRNAHKEEETLSSLPQIRANVQLLDNVIPDATQ